MQSDEGVAIRAATAADIPAILSLWREAEAVSGPTDTPEGVARAMETGPSAVLLAEHDGIPVGALIVGWDGWRGTFYRLAVLPPARRRGVATRLVREGERLLRARGAIRVGALVMAHDTRARAFWEAAGYVHDDRLVRYLRTDESPPDGTGPLR